MLAAGPAPCAGRGWAMSTGIFYFGGYQATIGDAAKWQGSAAEQTADDVLVFTYAWPAGANADAQSAVATFKAAGTLARAVAQIGSSGADRIYIVGHSSGCAIANAVDRSLASHDAVTLVALDGFVPDRDQLARPATQVWAAVCGKAVSLNHDKLKKRLGGRLKVYQATGCNTMWALHYSVVNAAASDTTVPFRSKSFPRPTGQA